MEPIFEKIFFVSTELNKMQEFCLFTQNVHSIAKCRDVEEFLKVLMENIFNEELSSDERRKFFAEHGLNDITCLNVFTSFKRKGEY